jgi:hypothetical protein
MRKQTAGMSLAGSALRDTRHVCAFFNSDEDEYRVLLPFIEDGFACGHKAVHVIDPQQQGAHLARLAGAGIDTAAATTQGQLELLATTETYLRDNRFDADRMVDVFTALASGNATHRFPLSRMVCRMDWAAADGDLVDHVIEFESRMNDLWRRHDDAVICTYHLGRFDGEAIVDLMRTHPMVIIGGVLQRNPFYAPPEEFLPEFRDRRARRNAARRGKLS